MDNIVQAVRDHINNVCNRVDPKRFGQEHAYIAALMGKLEGIAWEDEENEASVVFKTTVVNDRGPNAAEKKYGADFAITLERSNRDTKVTKAVIGQAKRGSLESLSKRENERLIQQCSMMSRHTSEYLVMETPIYSNSVPMIVLPKRNLILSNAKITLTDYIIDFFVACKHGDQRSNFISAVEESKLNRLEVIMTGLSPDLSLTLEPSPPQRPQSPRK